MWWTKSLIRFEIVERFERRLIEDALHRHGNTREVAKTLELGKSSIVRGPKYGK